MPVKEPFRPLQGPSRQQVVMQLEQAARLVIADTRRRAARGVDINGRKFIPYSSYYIEQLRRGGESTNVDLSVTGSLLQSLMIREKSATAVAVGPSPTERGPDVVFADGVVKRKGLRDMSQERLGRALHYGDPSRGLPPRPWLGLGPDGKKAVKRLFDKLFRVRVK